MKTNDFPSELRSFAKVFEKLAYHHNYSEVFDDFLTMSMCCFARNSEEQLYLERARKYSPDELKLFSSLLAELMIIYSKCETWTDPLGTFYEVFASKYKRSGFGQFFTPEVICDFKAQILNPGEHKLETVNDPACGSGRLLLASHYHSKGNVELYAEDLDGICVKMTCLNFLFHGAVGEVVHHNSLAVDHWIEGWIVNMDFKLLGLPSILRLQKHQSLIMKHRQIEEDLPKPDADESVQLSFNF